MNILIDTVSIHCFYFKFSLKHFFFNLKITIFISRSSIPKHKEMKLLWDSTGEILDKPIEK